MSFSWKAWTGAVVVECPNCGMDNDYSFNMEEYHKAPAAPPLDLHGAAFCPRCGSKLPALRLNMSVEVAKEEVKADG